MKDTNILVKAEDILMIDNHLNLIDTSKMTIIYHSKNICIRVLYAVEDSYNVICLTDRKGTCRSDKNHTLYALSHESRGLTKLETYKLILAGIIDGNSEDYKDE